MQGSGGNKHCCYGTCKSDTRRLHLLPEGIKFIPFPKPGNIRDGMTELEKEKVKLKTEKTKRWIHLCGRKDFNSIEQVTKNTYMCSLHFHSLAGPTAEHPEPFPASLSANQQELIIRRKRKAPKDRTLPGPSGEMPIKKVIVPVETPNSPDQISRSTTIIDTDPSTSGNITELNTVVVTTISDEVSINKQEDKTTQTVYDRYILNAKIETMILRNQMNKKIKNKTNPMTPDNILKDKKKTKYFIGLYPAQFEALYSFLGQAKFELNYWRGYNKKSKTKCGNKNKARHFTAKEELFITLLRLRRGFIQKTIAHFYNVSVSLIGSIFTTWIQFLYLHFKELSGPMFPTRDILKFSLPKVFKSFKNVRCTVDCTEFFCQTPRNYAQQGNVYSSYKHHTTLKALIAVTPNGAACFVSHLYEGSIDDVEITKRCGILNHIQPGDVILVDKGFKIQELLYSKQASIKIPAFLGKRNKLTKGEEIDTKRIAKARIHVERFNERLKKFLLIGKTIPLSLIPLASQLVFVASCLVNFQQPLCK